MHLLYLITKVVSVISVLLLVLHDSSTHNCFHQPAEECPAPEEICRCRLLSNFSNAAICCDVDHYTLIKGLSCAHLTARTDIEYLHIRNASFKNLDLSMIVPMSRKLHAVSITDGNISQIEGEFGKHSRVECLNLSSNHINSIEDRAFVPLFKLSVLDLSFNNLTEVPSFRNPTPPANITLDISNNTNLNCSKLNTTLEKHTEISFVNENETFCLTSKKDFWFDVEALIPLSELKAMHRLKKICYPHCYCSTYRLNLSQGKLSTFEVAMSCIGQGFTALPVPLPNNTIYLDVSNNNITSIKELSDPSYQNLRYFLADNNQISSIQPLEGTKFISNFDTLSLQRNKIKIFETYVLDNIQFERNYNQRKMKLAFNKLQCDCNTMKLKVWLLSKLSHIPDHEDIKCQNMNVKVIELDAAKICQSPPDWTDYIYYLIGVEIVLLIALVSKVTYDYWVFKSVGYLPWPANRMPKLPCDWLCE